MFDRRFFLSSLEDVPDKVTLLNRVQIIGVCPKTGVDALPTGL